MSDYVYAPQRDLNHGEIAKAYEAMFCSVIDLHKVGFGCPDLLIGCAGISALVEVKTDAGELGAAQRTFVRDWRGGKVRIVRSPEDAIEHVKSIRAKQAGV